MVMVLVMSVVDSRTSNVEHRLKEAVALEGRLMFVLIHLARFGKPLIR